MRKLHYLHPATYIALINQSLADADLHPIRGVLKRRFNREVTKGIEAAIALALDVPGVYVNPFHPGLTATERDAMNAAGL